MAKTKPLGVRFDEDILGKVKSAGLASSPQKALNLYEKSYLELQEWIKMASGQPSSPIDYKKVVALKEDGSAVAILDLSKKAPKSNYTIDTTQKEKKQPPEGLSRAQLFKWMKDNS